MNYNSKQVICIRKTQGFYFYRSRYHSTWWRGRNISERNVPYWMNARREVFLHPDINPRVIFYSSNFPDVHSSVGRFVEYLVRFIVRILIFSSSNRKSTWEMLVGSLRKNEYRLTFRESTASLSRSLSNKFRYDFYFWWAFAKEYICCMSEKRECAECYESSEERCLFAQPVWLKFDLH